MTKVSNKEFVRTIFLKTLPAILVWSGAWIIASKINRNAGAPVNMDVLLAVYVVGALFIVGRLSGPMFRRLVSDDKERL